MRSLPLIEHAEVFISLTSRGEPLFWKVDEFGHVAPLDEGETIPDA
ncbi:hypothetical protein [Pseudactinotalea sp.]